MVELRWVEKVGYGLTGINKMETVKTKVLQYRHQLQSKPITENGKLIGLRSQWSEWIDVPTETEE